MTTPSSSAVPLRWSGALLSGALLFIACGEASSPRAQTSPCAGAATYQGEATYYGADGSGNCSFPATPDDLDVAAINDHDYAASASCGACVRVQGPKGAITLRIVDRCPECPAGNLDLSASAFRSIAEVSAGRVPITWSFAPCAVEGNLRYHFKEGSSAYWTAVQVRNHRIAVAKLEFRDAQGQWQAMERQNYNYFVRSSGLGPGPYAFRVTDASGQVIEDADIPLRVNEEVSGSGQFPGCP